MVNNKAKQISHVKTLQYMLNMQCNANMDVCVFRVSVTKTNHFDYNILEYLDIWKSLCDYTVFQKWHPFCFNNN